MNTNAPHTNTAAAYDPDHTIDQALSALRDAQPRSGLEDRILTSLEHRAATRATDPGGLPFHSFIVKGWGIARETTNRIPHLALWAATSTAIIALASLTILHHRNTSMANESSASVQHIQNPVILSGARTGSPASLLAGAESAQSKDPDIARATTNTEPFSTTNPAATTHTLSSRPERVARSAETCISDHHDLACPIHDDATGVPGELARRGGNVVMGGIATTPNDAQLLADLHAPSHPAPPLPPTPQERLFLYVLRYGNATQLAELDPVVRAQHNADEATAFKTFFPDPPPLKQPLGDAE